MNIQSKSEKLMYYIGQIDDNIIEEAYIDFSDSKPVSKTKPGYKAMNRVLKWLIPAAACFVIVIASVFIMPNLFNGPEIDIPLLSGVVIVGDKHDGFVSNAEAFEPAYISPMLREAMDSANPGDLIKTIVSVPGFWEYRNGFEVDGVTYWDYYMYVTSGAWKDGDTNRRENSAEMWEKLEAMEEAAYESFREKAIADLSIKIGAFEITDDEYFKHGYTFIANLSPEQIKLLEKEKIFMLLWAPNWNGPVFELEPAIINDGIIEPGITRN